MTLISNIAPSLKKVRPKRISFHIDVFDVLKRTFRQNYSHLNTSYRAKTELCRQKANTVNLTRFEPWNF